MTKIKHEVRETNEVKGTEGSALSKSGKSTIFKTDYKKPGMHLQFFSATTRRIIKECITNQWIEEKLGFKKELINQKGGGKEVQKTNGTNRNPSVRWWVWTQIYLNDHVKHKWAKYSK